MLGIHTEGKYQIIYIDTPGLYTKNKYHNNIYTDNIIINNLIKNVEIVIFVVDSIVWTSTDKMILHTLRNIKAPVILVINKVDNILRKTNLLPHLLFLSKEMYFLDIIPVSAKTGMNVNIVTSVVHKNLPEAIHKFSAQCITDCSQQFIISEIIREKLMRFLGDELPYSTNVKIKCLQDHDGGVYYIDGLIFVKKIGQKKILIGSKGNMIKIISMAARKDIQKAFKIPICLTLWVKVIAYN